MEQEGGRVYRVWVDTQRRVVSFHEIENGEMLEFSGWELFLRCVDQYASEGYRYQ